MIFIETQIFEEDIQQLMPDEAYALFQQYLTGQPDAGDVIRGTGGVRMIYYWRTAENQILMLLVYKKTSQEDLTPAQKRALRSVVENWNG